MPLSASEALRELEALKYDFSPTATTRKIDLFKSLGSGRLASADDVRELHGSLKFSRAYPENAEILGVVESILARFEDRKDLRRFRRELTDSGLAGTNLHFRFYWLTAIWLWHFCKNQLTIEWKEFENKEKLEGLLHLLLPFSESPALDAIGYTAREWLDTLRAPDETDAAFLIRRFDSLDVPTPMREKLYEDLDIPMVLTSGPGTPAKGREKWAASPVVFPKRPPDRKRPNLRRAIGQEKFDVRPVSPATGQKLIDLANFCMVSRHRDLLIFLNGDKQDVRMIDFGDGLQFACIGAVPDRRLMLESVYGFLTLMNGVPIGYVLCSAFYESTEVAYNVFDTFRGAGAAKIYGRVLGMIHGLFGARSFAVDPYQLGHNNDEGLDSGAWWFYYKLGFRPRDAGVKALVKKELAAIKANPRHRTQRSRLNDMASEYMYLQLGGARSDVLGEIDLGNIGLHVSAYLTRRFGSERERGIAVCAEEAARLLDVKTLRKLTPGERIAWERWAPLVLAIPGLRNWTPRQRRALRDVMLAKGGQRESDYVRLFDRHKRLRIALLQLADEPAPAP
ncbi:MAG: hypothetical protein ACYTGZ_03755 [Planctomycetota bacterium]|jgi:hypothetical protein